MTIVNTDRPSIEWLLETVGSGSVFDKARREAHYKPLYTWQIYGHNAVALLKQLVPYMIIKRAKALSAIETQARPAS